MLTTSNFPAKQQRLTRLLACAVFAVVLVYAGAVVASAQEVAPDAPRPARASNRVVSNTKPRPRQAKPVELSTVSIRRLDERMSKMAGADFVKRATAPLVIEVRTQEPLGDLTRTSSPVIVLNGEVLSETIPLSTDRLIAFLPDRKFIRETNTITVVWLGNEELTRTRRPLRFRSRDIK
jgi:hypothetical protein